MYPFIRLHTAQFWCETIKSRKDLSSANIYSLADTHIKINDVNSKI